MKLKALFDLLMGLCYLGKQENLEINAIKITSQEKVSSQIRLFNLRSHFTVCCQILNENRSRKKSCLKCGPTDQSTYYHLGCSYYETVAKSLVFSEHSFFLHHLRTYHLDINESLYWDVKHHYYYYYLDTTNQPVMLRYYNYWNTLVIIVGWSKTHFWYIRQLEHMSFKIELFLGFYFIFHKLILSRSQALGPPF